MNMSKILKSKFTSIYIYIYDYYFFFLIVFVCMIHKCPHSKNVIIFSLPTINIMCNQIYRSNRMILYIIIFYMPIFFSFMNNLILSYVVYYYLYQLIFCTKRKKEQKKYNQSQVLHLYIINEQFQLAKLSVFLFFC